MHFTKTNHFIRLCFQRQQFDDIDLLVAVDWRYDDTGQLGQTTLLNPLFEQQMPATIEVSSQKELTSLQNTINSRFIEQFHRRIRQLSKPTHHVVAEYDSWPEFRDVWFIRSNQNITRVSVPLLCDVRQSKKTNHHDVFMTIYVTKSQEFYRFAIAQLSPASLKQLRQDLQQLVEEAYG